MENQLFTVAEKVGEFLIAKGHKLVTAESCTGGWVTKVITDIAGSSEWFDCGFVTYSNTSKDQLLGVRQSTLSEYGAVSQQTVQEMVAGALKNSAAHCALAVTGIAGPGGGSEDKPVGTVWFAWQQSDGKAITALEHFYGNRIEIRRQAVRRALDGVLSIYTA